MAKKEKYKLIESQNPFRVNEIYRQEKPENIISCSYLTCLILLRFSFDILIK